MEACFSRSHYQCIIETDGSTVCCAGVQVTQESREAEDIQLTVAEEEQAVGVQTAETAALKGKPDLGCTHHVSTSWADK